VETPKALGAAGPLVGSLGKESLFNCLFGRDAIRTAMDLLDDFPQVARATLLDLARLQGVRVHPRAEEEPGRILHEHREPDDPIRQQNAGRWDFPFYGPSTQHRSGSTSWPRTARAGSRCSSMSQ
jgi:glycogen debranching enzyme